MVIPAVNSLPEAERARALDRFRILQSFLEEEIPLTQVARQHGLALRTAQRWVKQYRQHGLAGLCRKEYAGKGRHRRVSQFQQAIEGLAACCCRDGSHLEYDCPTTGYPTRRRWPRSCASPAGTFASWTDC